MIIIIIMMMIPIHLYWFLFLVFWIHIYLLWLWLWFSAYFLSGKIFFFFFSQVKFPTWFKSSLISCSSFIIINLTNWNERKRKNYSFARKISCNLTFHSFLESFLLLLNPKEKFLMWWIYFLHRQMNLGIFFSFTCLQKKLIRILNTHRHCQFTRRQRRGRKVSETKKKG